MVIHRADGSVEHRHFYDITDYIAPEDVPVINDSRSFPRACTGTPRAGGGTAGASAPAPARAGYVGMPGQPGKRARIGARCVFGNGILTGEVTDIPRRGIASSGSPSTTKNTRISTTFCTRSG